MYFDLKQKSVTARGEQALTSANEYIQVYGQRLSFKDILINWTLALLPIYLMFGICGVSIDIRFDALTCISTAAAIVVVTFFPALAYHRKMHRRAILQLNFLLHSFPNFYYELCMAEKADSLWDYSHKQLVFLLRKDMAT